MPPSQLDLRLPISAQASSGWGAGLHWPGKSNLGKQSGGRGRDPASWRGVCSSWAQLLLPSARCPGAGLHAAVPGDGECPTGNRLRAGGWRMRWPGARWWLTPSGPQPAGSSICDEDQVTVFLLLCGPGPSLVEAGCSPRPAPPRPLCPLSPQPALATPTSGPLTSQVPTPLCCSGAPSPHQDPHSLHPHPIPAPHP